MSSSYDSAVECAESHLQLHPAYANLYKRAQSDAQFVRSLATRGAGTASRSGPNPAPVVDSYSCRQKFLRSYTFSKKETVPQKTAKCFGKVKQRATDLPCIRRPTNDSGEYLRMLTRGDEYHNKTNKTKKRRSMLWCIFRRLLSCMSNFDVGEGNSVVHAL